MRYNNEHAMAYGNFLHDGFLINISPVRPNMAHCFWEYRGNEYQLTRSLPAQVVHVNYARSFFDVRAMKEKVDVLILSYSIMI